MSPRRAATIGGLSGVLSARGMAHTLALFAGALRSVGP